jgi:lipopolysaccharide transport system permease protein
LERIVSDATAPAVALGRPAPSASAHLPGLIWTLVRTEFKTRYHGTIGGFVWALFKPLAMFFVLWGVFSFIFRGDPDYKLDLLIGLFFYDFFAEATKTALVSLRVKGFLLTKARFPSWIIVAASTSNALITLVLFSAATIVLVGLSGRLAGPGHVALFLLYEICLLAIVLGFGLASSVLFLRYRDLNQVWDVVAQAGFFVAPIIYPLQSLPHNVHFLVYLWPPTPAILFARMTMVDGQVPSLVANLCLVGESVIVFVVGALIYRRFAPRAAEYL